MDLHLRGYPDKRRTWATLYCGLTNALDLIETGGDFRLKAAAKWRAYDQRDLPWEQPLTPARLAATWPDVESYLDNVIPEIEKGRYYEGEGAVQNAVGRMFGNGFTVFDREVVVGYSNTAERDRVRAAELAPLLEVVSSPPAGEGWWKPPQLGNKCDAVALGADGQLIAIEVKRSADTGGVVWAPLQAALYARLFRRWAADDQMWGEHVVAMLSQRTRLGLVPAQDWQGQRPTTTRAAVIIGGEAPPSAEARRRCRLVRDRLVDAGLFDELPVSLLVGNTLQPLFASV